MVSRHLSSQLKVSCTSKVSYTSSSWSDTLARHLSTYVTLDLSPPLPHFGSSEVCSRSLLQGHRSSLQQSCNRAATELQPLRDTTKVAVGDLYVCMYIHGVLLSPAWLKIRIRDAHCPVARLSLFLYRLLPSSSCLRRLPVSGSFF